MRRPRFSRALALGTVLTVGAALAAPLGRASTTTPAAVAGLDANTAAAKVSRSLQALVAHGGYVDDAFYRTLPDYVAGHVYYLAKLRAPADAGTLQALERAGARVRWRYRTINWVALSSPVLAVTRVAKLAQVERLDPDLVQDVLATEVEEVPGDGFADQTKRGTSDVRADELWRMGITGKNVTLGVADSGIDGAHPDFDDLDWQQWGEPADPKLVEFMDCTNAAPIVGEPAEPEEGEERVYGNRCLPTPAYDDNGHGSHVSGIATGSAEGGGPDQHGLYPGMAPDALLAGAKVCLAAGSCLGSSVIAGLEYLAIEPEEGGAGADVVNASLGGGRLYGAPVFTAEQVTNNDTYGELVNAVAPRNNVLFTFSAGNSGPVIQSVGSPGVAAQALGVGASAADFDRDAPVEETAGGEFGEIRPEAVAAGASVLADFSSRGPSGDRLIKPDLTAPGVYYIAAEGTLGAEIRAADFAHRNHFSNDPTYAVISGTSMSSPAAAGVAALVIDGYQQTTGKQPDYYKVKAAMANTAGARAWEGPVAGLIGTITTKVTGSTPEEEFPIRNEEWVGVTGEGAGRVDALSSHLALTRGVIAYTPLVEEVDDTEADTVPDDIHEWQPSWSLDEVAPGESATGRFVLEGGPEMSRAAKVSFSMVDEPEARSIRRAPKSWFKLPGKANVRPGKTTEVSPSFTVPANATPGLYTAVILARVPLGGGVTQTLRLPVQFSVPLADASEEEGDPGSIEDDIWASEPTDYSMAGWANPLGDIFTDWITYPVRLEEGTARVDLSVYDVAGADHMDLFVFDGGGAEIDSTVTFYTDHVVPNGLAYAPTTEESPATVSLFDGDDVADVVLPATVWVVVSNSGPANPPGFSKFHLDLDVVGGGEGGTTPPERIHSGTHAWWGGSAANADSHLTQPYDLSAVSASAAPKLEFWTWYELEDGYDWAFALVSTDDGATWTSLRTAAAGGSGTTTLDPIGDVGGGALGSNKPYPNGITGSSGSPPIVTQGALAPVYTQHTADLTPYAGQSILLRFLYTSDPEVHRAGFYVDDIAVVGTSGPLEVGSTNPDDAETESGWVGGGAPGFEWVEAQPEPGS